ncbi:hypothetical protein [Qipengyuania sp. R86523]|uniref:hypothetical protein n=1 Tax=Qipengyuania sp. R86523 TaxID=3093862 RepID=UPI0037C712EC
MRIDVRLSLRTKDRVEARNRGAALTAAMPKVTSVLRKNVEANPNITEAELRGIAAAMYEEKLQEVCDDQRSTATLGELHCIANLAYIDFFQRMTELGGRMSFLPSEQKAKKDAGWDQQRIDDLKTVIQKDEAEGLSPLRKKDIVRHLELSGFAASAKNQWRLEVVLYPFYRDVFVDAQVALQDLVDPVGKTDCFDAGAEKKSVTDKNANSSSHPTRNVNTTDENLEDEWSNLSPLEVAEKMIASNSLPLEHRDGGKRARPQTHEHTLRQIRWAATLLQKSLPTGTPLCSITQDDLKTFDCHLEHISVHYGKSPADRRITDTLEDAAARAANKVNSGNVGAEFIGLHLRTSNRHFERLKQIYNFIPVSYLNGGAVDFSCFITPVDEDEFAARDRLSREQGEAIFQLPPWTGCKSVENKGRLKAGKAILHDGLFFVLLLVWYTGARREEICKLMLDDVEGKDGYYYLAIRPTITGRLKNKSARRVVVICDELIRLGFLRYVEAMREAGETLLFPELMPASSTKRKLGDVFYKIWWVHIAPHVPDLKRGQAMHSARHMVSDELKDQEVFIEFRNDHLGHKGKGGEGVTRYPSRTSLAKLKTLVEKIPVVTAHIPDQHVINLLPDWLRTPRPSRKENKAS